MQAAEANALALACRRAQRYAEALQYAELAVRLSPAHPGYLANLGNALREARQPEAALAAYAQALKLLPAGQPGHAEIQFNRALALLMLGRHAEGFAAFLWKRQTANEPPAPVTAPRWQGENLSGHRLLLQATEGYGDTLQMLRFIPGLARQGVQVSLCCAPALLPLLQPMHAQLGLHSVFSPHSLPAPTGNVWSEVYSLPHFCHATDQLPWLEPYLPRLAIPPAYALPAGGPRFGLVWACHPQAASATRRSCELQQLQPLLQAFPGQFYSLQTGDAAVEALALPAAIRPRPLPFALSDFAATAAVLQQLDRLITVDTASAHLAGALGCPAELLLPFAADWRWGLSDSAPQWYGSLRHWWQHTPGDWQEPVNALIKPLMMA
ncbi:MAG: hypothetical protein IGS03_09735 [Candidatus Sericytochromatia bacterium]|nr:hypothetical protein [Candidatus Sericytochromatia bacterium]